MLLKLFLWLMALFSCCLPVYADVVGDLAFPYRLNPHESAEVHPGSREILYVSLENYNNEEEPADITIHLPEGLTALSGEGWVLSDEGRSISLHWNLPSDYGNTFEAIPVETDFSLSGHSGEIRADFSGNDFHFTRDVSFTVGETKAEEKKESSRETWYVQSVVLPVNESGEEDSRAAKDTLVVPDVTLESIRQRLTGKAIDKEALLSKPSTYLLLDLRNPQKDRLSVHFRAELVDKESGEVKEGLISSAGDAMETNSSGEADFSLNGNKMQTVVIPLFADPFSITEGDYSLRITLNDGINQKITEVPLTVIKNRSVGLLTTGFSCLCLVIVLLSLRKIKKTMAAIGARGDISAALFASLAFGGVVVPVTLLGDFLHVILGPFSGLVTGLLSGVVQYLLLMALLVLFRKSGVAALFYLIRWLLSAVLFGRVTPVGILLCAASIVVIEGALYLSGFYRKKEITPRYGLFISFVLGICDAGLTLVNMEQLMLFYRLYYADWFIGLYMIINGLVYSTLGSWLGWKTGNRLRQVMGS